MFKFLRGDFRLFRGLPHGGRKPLFSTGSKKVVRVQSQKAKKVGSNGLVSFTLYINQVTKECR